MFSRFLVERRKADCLTATASEAIGGARFELALA